MEIEAFCELVTLQGTNLYPSPALVSEITQCDNDLAKQLLGRLTPPETDEAVERSYERAFIARQALVATFGKADDQLWPAPQKLGRIPVMCQVPSVIDPRDERRRPKLIANC